MSLSKFALSFFGTQSETVKRQMLCLFVHGLGVLVGRYAHLFPCFMTVEHYLKKSLWPQLPPTIAVVLEIQAVERLCYDWFTKPNTLLTTIPDNLPQNLLHFCSASRSSSSCIKWAFIRNWLSCGQKLYCKYKTRSLFHKLFEITTLFRPECACSALQRV